MQTDIEHQPIISAHEFHYSHLVNISEPLNYAYLIHRGSGIDGQYDGIVYKNLLACYAHLQDTNQNHWAKRFIQFIHHLNDTQSNDTKNKDANKEQRTKNLNQKTDKRDIP